MRITVFPYLKQDLNTNPNPYIRDMVQALSELPDIEIANPAHPNPLLSLLKPNRQGDIVILNWFESIPDFKHGYIQSFIAIIWFVWLKLQGKKIVWILHNKHPHNTSKQWLKKCLTNLVAHGSNLIITHASEGVEVIRKRFPSLVKKVHFLHHPTKNRLEESQPVQPEYDFLIWGHITVYKGVLEYLQYRKNHPQSSRTCIIGACSSQDLCLKLENARSEGVDCFFHSPSFDELRSYIKKSRFVLIPYHADSILSSGILMDSLSFGARIIGPDTGAFRDYSHEERLKVYTFRSFEDLDDILHEHGNEPVDFSAYRSFLTENDWPHFICCFLSLLRNQPKL